MEKIRRDFLKLASAGMAGLVTSSSGSAMTRPIAAQETQPPSESQHGIPSISVRAYGAKGDGTSIDTPAINRAIEAAEANGGGTVWFPAGNYLCYSIHLKSNVALFLDQGAVIVAADPLPEGQAGGYDDPEPVQPWEAYQDYGHNHWHNSLLWGENLHDVSIYGPGHIWGKGLVRSNGPENHNPAGRRTQGVGNKSIALKNCRNVHLRDFQILQGGWFGILATGVDIRRRSESARAQRGCGSDAGSGMAADLRA
ncbi:MAG TPA: glycosyl hydrolase family 28-related protein [Acidobacteriaceae bacterium]|nr:glycosyl hydrolase family 28-related protein [Acidobacteriaceae bacterium]